MRHAPCSFNMFWACKISQDAKAILGDSVVGSQNSSNTVVARAGGAM